LAVAQEGNKRGELRPRQSSFQDYSQSFQIVCIWYNIST